MSIFGMAIAFKGSTASRRTWKQERGNMAQALRVEDTDVVEARAVTLLDLVQAVADVTDDDREIVATVMHMLRAGRVKLCGNFRDEPIELF